MTNKPAFRACLALSALAFCGGLALSRRVSAQVIYAQPPQQPPVVYMQPHPQPPPPPVVYMQQPQQPQPQVNPDCYRQQGPFSWHCAGPVAGQQCTQIVEGADPHTWNDNYFCTARPMGIRWSYAGPVAGMRCTQIFEYADPHTWQDNYLCVPPTSPVHFAWSQAGPLEGMQCLQWIEPADPHTWSDNYLCWAFAR